MKNYFTKMVFAIAVVISSTNVFAGGGGRGSTQCNANELGLKYSFSGYTRSLNVGDLMMVFTTSPEDKSFGFYRITEIDDSGTIGVIKLVSGPSPYEPKAPGTNFGGMILEYFSNSALTNIKVTFSKDGIESSSKVNCFAD